MFTGFFGLKHPPVLNRVSAGTTVNAVFSLGGDFGLDVFASGSPAVYRINCSTKAATGPLQAATGTLTYNAGTGRYTYAWQTSTAWKQTCRALELTFNDGVTERQVFFKFRS